MGATALSLHDYSSSGTYTTPSAASAPLHSRANATSSLLFWVRASPQSSSPGDSAPRTCHLLGLILHPRALSAARPRHEPISAIRGLTHILAAHLLIQHTCLLYT